MDITYTRVLGGRLLSIEIPSDVTFAQRKGWPDKTSWEDNKYFTVKATHMGQEIVGR